MQFQNFGPEDFLQEKSFLQYCLGGDHPDVRFWEHWIAANPHKSSDVTRAREMYYMLNGNLSSDRFLADEKRFRQAFLAGSAEVVQMKPVRGRRRWLISAAAAAVIVMFSVAGFLRNEPNLPGKSEETVVYRSGAGEKRSVQLPDGSTVMLNSESSLSVSSHFNITNREVLLKGEGYFQVSHDKARPFIVRTRVMDVQVLGTVFNVRAYDSETTAETSLVSGSVDVNTKGTTEEQVRLKPNEKLVVTANEFEVVSVSANDDAKMPEEVMWTKETLVFRDDRLVEIAGTLERWYGVKVSILQDDLKDYRYTGHFEKKTLAEVLEALSLSRPFRFDVGENGEVRIRKK